MLKQPMEFTEFLKVQTGDLPNDQNNMGRKTPWGPTGWKRYTMNDATECDYVAKMENLHEELGIIFERIGIPFEPHQLPHRLGITNANATYREYYGPEDKVLVERLYEKELRAFDYEF